AVRSCIAICGAGDGTRSVPATIRPFVKVVHVAAIQLDSIRGKWIQFPPIDGECVVQVIGHEVIVLRAVVKSNVGRPRRRGRRAK
ncbi:MAG: hypothetical protein WD669_00005, partial [Pirellulales bacterium]